MSAQLASLYDERARAADADETLENLTAQLSALYGEREHQAPPPQRWSPLDEIRSRFLSR
jgi:hypothetical protein